ncbi:MAG: hypothetical protein LAO51_20210 [Acidobacteriia bacterium]|nr:hypothetical protein [Terriglobia bacterium]
MAMHNAIARACGCVALCAALTFALAGTDERTPKNPGLVEKAGAHLGQFDVTVTGPRDAASRLTPGDFEVQVGKLWLTTFQLDPMCAADTSHATTRPASYLFYFDQRHLTQVGRRRAIEVLREMVPRLIVDGSRGMVVSNAKTLRVYTTFTSRTEVILRAIAELEHDPDQVDSSPLLEEMRVAEVQAAIGKNDVSTEEERRQDACPHLMIGVKGEEESRQTNSANLERMRRGESLSGQQVAPSLPTVLLVKQYNQDEMAVAREGLCRIASMLRRLGGIEAPKVFLYFADTMRRNAGEHFVRMLPGGALVISRNIRGGFGSHIEQTMSASDAFVSHRSESGGSEGAYENVLAEAAAQNVRFYPVQAEGLDFSSDRVRDAQDTLASLAAESGGKAFLNGVPADRMTRDILGDLSCRYLLSFDPAGFPEDRPLPVRVRVHGKKLSAQAGSQIVIQSEAARRASRLLAAFSGTNKSATNAISATVIPTGYADGAFTGLVQVVVPSPSDTTGSWEIGGNVVSGNSSRELPTRTIATNVSGVPVVFESEEKFHSGRHEVIAVARETSTDTIVSQVVEVTWPEISDSTTILPITVFQPARGAFVRGNVTRAQGSIVRTESQQLRPDAPTALVALVCWGEEQKGKLHIERALHGDAESNLSFPAIDLEREKDRCEQVRDMIPARTMGAGQFRYSIVVSQGTEELARTERSFSVQATPPPPQLLQSALK